MIPSVPILHVRMLINCWELGLESVPEEAVLLMASAVEVTALVNSTLDEFNFFAVSVEEHSYCCYSEKKNLQDS